jgi:hypothetical protein
MSFYKAAIALGLVGCLVIAGAYAQDILFPNMTAEKGTWDAPHGKMGEKGKTEWTQTTYAAGVDGKPLPGKVVSLVGEIIDVSCYTSLGKHGAKHRDCGQKCAKNGEPIGLLTKDGTVYILMAEEHDPRRDGQTTFRQAAIDNMAYIMEVTGTLTEVKMGKANVPALFVRGYVKK